MAKKGRWKKYAIEFLSVFVAVVFAFALNNWNENRRSNNAERKILSEISNGLKKDLLDVEVNTGGHQQGILACNFWRNVINNKPVNLDSTQFYYMALTRDFITIQNTAGYQTLKSKGLELIQNDSLRLEIISIYEYDFASLQKLEENYQEMQFHENYFKEINEFISPYLEFDSTGNISNINLSMNLDKIEKKRFLTYLWKIQTNRGFVLYFYSEIERKTKTLIANIEKELD